MNKHCYRLIFSRTHGELRVVSELARSCSTEPGQSRGNGAPRLWVTVRRAVWMLGLAIVAGPAIAGGIVADGSAAPGLRPQVIATQNGLSQVNITAPNQAGVSHNQFTQFDVDRNGAILNNSSLMTSTQLAGMIQGNPNLKPGNAPARVILNEVNSNNPSQLRGFLEVAGGRAQVIVANPSGIVCSGCGTINAGRMTLTTGKPQRDASGAISGYQVERGTLRIEGGGLNGDARHDTGYVDLLARAVEVNAGIWANDELAVIAGRNRISADGKSVQPISGGGAKPELAIDMGQMGGMYSGQIRMMGTETGVGVRNQGGHLQAGNTLTVSSAGRLVWQPGKQEAFTQAAGNITLTAQDSIEHHGKLHSGGTLTVESRGGDIRQSGTLAAAGDVYLKAGGNVTSSGHLLAGSNANSQLVQAADLILNSQGDIRASGSLLSKKEVSLSARQVDTSQSQLAARHATIAAKSGSVAIRQAKIDSGSLDIRTTGNIEAQQSQVKAGRWDISARNLLNHEGAWSQSASAESRFTISGTLDNSHGTIEAQRLALNSGSLINQYGRLVSLDGTAQHWQIAGNLNNTRGELGSNGDLALDASRLINQNGTLVSQAALSVSAGGDIDNAAGQLLAGKRLTLNTAGAIDNRGGTLNGGELKMTMQQLHNAQGSVISQGDLNLASQQDLDNRQGMIGAGGRLIITTEGDWHNQAGTAQGETELSVSAQNIDNAGGRLLSGQRLTLNARQALDNRDGEIGGETLRLIAGRIDNSNGRIIGQHSLTLEARQVLQNTLGLLAAGKQLDLAAQRFNNAEGRIVAQQDLKLNAQQALDNTGGLLEAGERLSVSSGGEWDNRKGTAQGGTAVIAAAARLDNRGGRLQSGGDLQLSTSGDVLNQAGRLTAQRALGWQGGAGSGLNNDGGSLQSGGSLSLTGGQLSNRQQGVVFSQQALSLALTGEWNNHNGTLTGSGTFDNHQGSVQSQQDATLVATSLNNELGMMQSAAGLALQITRDIVNRAGKISAGGQLSVQGENATAAGRLNNAGGQLLAGERLTVSAREVDNRQSGLLYSQQQMMLMLGEGLDNRSGQLQSGESLTLVAQSLLNGDGAIDSQQQLALRIFGEIANAAGAIRSNGDQHITAGQIDNRKGVFSSRGGMEMTVVRLENTDGTVISQGRGIYRVETLNNRQGKIHSGNALTLTATQVSNQSGQLVSTGALALHTAQLDNSAAGTVSSQDALSVQAERLNNRDGGLLLGSALTTLTVQALDNTAGRLQSAGAMTFSGLNTLDNRQGRILANGALSFNARAVASALALLNQGGAIQSGNTLHLNTRTLNNQGGMLQSQQALTLAVQTDYTHRTGDTLNSNTVVTLTVAGVMTNLTDWLLPGSLTLNSTHLTNRGSLVGKVLRLTTGMLVNGGRLEANRMTLNVDTLDNAAAVMGDEITIHGRIVDNHGEAAAIAAVQDLDLQATQRVTNRDGSLIYSGDRLHLGSGDLIENRASFIEADGDITIEARRLENLREGLEIERDAEKSEYKWHRYNYYWRSYGSEVGTDKNTMTPTTQQMTFQNEDAVKNSPYGTLLEIDATGKRAKVRVKYDKGAVTDMWVNYLSLIPHADGSYDMTFYETRGFRQNDVPTPYHNTFWREHDRGRLEQWDPERHLDIFDAPFVDDYNNLRERSVTGTASRDRLISEGTGARILAGGSMALHITDRLLNDASTISANGNLSIGGGGTVENKGYSVNERRQEYIVDHYDRNTKHWYPTFNRDETTALTTIDGIITGNGNVTISGASISNTTVNQAQISSVEAALKAAEAERAEWQRNPLAFEVEGAGRQEGETQLAPGSKPSETITFPGRPLLPAELALTEKQHLGDVATSIPNNGLFRQDTAAGSPFLIVTDERFTSRSKFISSDYMLERVGYDPSRVQKRLGDGFYEQRLVREQVLKLTGRASVRGEDAMEQYQQLMNNGVKVAEAFSLVPGVALTPEQISALQQDIVWLVSETVQTASGPQTVWVPKVYLAQNTLRLTGDGALIAGGNLQLSADSVQNAGNLFADRALSIDATDFRHQGGEIKADSINVQADSLSISTNLQDALRQATMSAGDISLSGSDISLQGAKLDATQNLSLNARNSLDISAAKSSHTASLAVISGAMGNRNTGVTEEAGKRMAQVSGEWQQAQGSQLSAGGNLSLQAGQDITLQGSQVKAGEQLGVQAGGDIKLLADSTSNKTQLEAGARTTSVSNSREEERLLLSTLSGDKGVSLHAGNTLLAAGAQVDSTAGNIGLSANDVTIKEAHQQTQDLDSERRGGGKSKSSRVVDSSRDEVTGSTFSGRDGVTVIAREGDITATGSTLHSEKGGIALQAKNDVLLDSATKQQSEYVESHSQKKRFLKKSTTHTVQNDRVTREQGTLLSGDTVSVVAGKDVTVSGSAIAADHDVTLQAGNNVDIRAATESESHYLLKEKKKRGLLGSGGIGFSIGKQSTRHELDEKGTTQSQSVSTVGSSQGNVSITAGDKLHIGGADLVAGKDLTLSGDSVQIDPGYDQRTRNETFETKQSGLSVALSGTAGSALNTAVSTAKQARKESDGRLSALQNTQAALSGVQAAQALERDGLVTEAANASNAAAGLQSGDNGAAQGATNTVGISASYGSQSSKSETHSESRQSQGSTLTAGQNLSINATGKNQTGGSGDITLSGSALKAGGGMTLDAARDINLLSAQNTERTEGKNSSKGGSVGVGIGAGAGGYGISVSASVNAGKGHEKGHGLTHTETTLDAGGGISLTSGRDTTLKGAQVSGEKITADVGRDLTLQSEQDSDRYDAKQQNVSAGGSFTFGSMTGSGYVSASRDKLHSNFDSVNEQTGLFAGDGGYQITVGKHTQLDGTVIASTADKAKNSLDTGTLGWSDIDNRADFSAEHSGGSLSTGGPVGKDLLTNMAGGMLSGANNSGHAAGTTQAAVSDGQLTVRDGEHQQQDIAELNRDVEHANDDSISAIFNKEKEQKRLKEAQLIGELGMQAMDIARSQGEIAALEAQKDPAKLAAARAELESKHKPGDGNITDAAVAQQAYNNAQAEWGTGSNVQKAMQAVTGALTALAGNNLAGALASGASPYLATEIKKRIGEDNVAANAMAHAVLGAVTAELNNQSALAGGVGAGGGELTARFIMEKLFPGKQPSELTESEKQQVSGLSQLAAGIAGGVASGDISGAVTGGQAGKNAVENNTLSLPAGMMNYGQAVASWSQYAQDNNLTPEQTQAGLDKLVKGDLPEGANITKVIVNGYKDGVLIVGAAYLGPAASAGKVVGGAVIAEIANGTYQWFNLNESGNENNSWDYTGSISAGITGALAPGRGVWQNVGIAAGGTVFTDGPDVSAVGSSAAGAWAGGIFGELAPGGVNSLVGKELPGFIYDIGGAFIYESVNDASKDILKKQEDDKQ
ncbi:hemagglutinin repeat-containing protein [Erwinia sp. S38]|uniref:hemagglutinin repeat-containing protein n=1 Tax=Erwinia sp. S38 TaxID=2769338 RepID=UPI00190CD755|nr:hemagglutinin repeat-containing protein [Erwinia sp. S38]MBK0003574.1 hemagglutinin repeat-containing protein [Erwinia sp. S38]